MPGVVEEYVRNQEVQERVHSDLYWAMREDGLSPQDVSNWVDERLREKPDMTATEMASIYSAEYAVAEYAGGRYEGIGADVYDHAQREREQTPDASIEEVYDRAAQQLIVDIREYDGHATESEPPKETAHRERIRVG